MHLVIQKTKNYFKTMDVVFWLKLRTCPILLQTGELGMRKKRKILYYRIQRTMNRTAISSLKVSPSQRAYILFHSNDTNEH